LCIERSRRYANGWFRLLPTGMGGEMSSMARCQCCGKEDSHYWTFQTVTIDCGALRGWKVQACHSCASCLSKAVIETLDSLKREAK